VRRHLVRTAGVAVRRGRSTVLIVPGPGPRSLRFRPNGHRIARRRGDPPRVA
jgi:hypothetical protein